ncbi:hypothetical protein, partial [Klebsiella pneumoniae]|uniref:hypothetical protein n=1 Tax=Klebsiella pneumoniae TaxID=573 RepID=UPI001C707AF8
SAGLFTPVVPVVRLFTVLVRAEFFTLPLIRLHVLMGASGVFALAPVEIPFTSTPWLKVA